MNMIQRKCVLCVLWGTLCASQSAWAQLEIFTCEPEWAALADEIGADKVRSFSATTAFQDAHFIQARPSLLARVRRADLVLCTGASLEDGWLPLLLRQAGNGNVTVGSDGFLEASQTVRLLDVPASPDRAGGDVHPYGNPHFSLDARNIAPVARTLAARLKQLDPENATHYAQRLDAFANKWTQALTRWENRAAPLSAMEIIVHHSSWLYLEQWLGLSIVGQMEPKPGLPPTASHLAELLTMIKRHNVQAFVRTAYQSPRAANWLAERTGIPELILPHTVGATAASTDLFSLYDDIIDRLLETRQKTQPHEKAQP